MLSKTVAVLALAASFGVVSMGPVLAGSKSSPRLASTENSPWYDTNSNAAQSRANLKEQVLTPAAVPKIRYLRSVVSPLISPSAPCPDGIVAPILVGGDLYAITNAELSKYNAATGALIWRVTPDPTFSSTYESLALSGNLVITGATDCQSETAQVGDIEAFNATTGAHVWSGRIDSGLGGAVVAQSFVIAQGTDGSGNCSVTVFNLATGAPVWSNFCSGEPPQFPLVVGPMVIYADMNGNLTARNLATGTLAWSLPGNTGINGFWQPQRGDISGTPGKHLYATNPSGIVVGLSPQTGQVQYSLTGVVNVLAVDTSRVYATCGSQGVCAYNISTGTLEWQHAQSPPDIAAEAGGVLYAGGDVLNAATGQVIPNVWSPYIGAASAVGDGRIAVASDPRVLDLFGLKGY